MADSTSFLTAKKGVQMATKPKKKEVQEEANLNAALPESLLTVPANRAYMFAKNCTNDHGRFLKGDKARGAFSDELVKSYVAAGILVPQKNG